MNPLDVLSFLVDNGLVYKGEMYARRCLIITEYEDTAPEDLAKALSRAFPVQAFFSDSAVCLKRGSLTLWIIPQENKHAMLAARDCVAYLGANKGKEPPYGIGACCRQLIEWLGAEQQTEDFSALMAEDTQYKAAIVGYYPGMYYYADLKGAYWQIVGAMPSPFVYETKKGPKFAKAAPEIAARWERLKEQCAGCKPLRLSMVGRMLGGNAARCFINGIPQAGRGIGKGKLSPAARLAILAVSELARAAFESTPGACYANLDCIVSEEERIAVFDKYGLKYGLKYHGDADIQGVGAYRIGEYESGLYNPEPDATRLNFYRAQEPRPELIEWLPKKDTISSSQGR